MTYSLPKPRTLTPEALLSDLEYVDNVRFIACSQCKTLVWANEVKTHFNNSTNHTGHAPKDGKIVQRLAQERWPTARHYPRGETPDSARTQVELDLQWLLKTSPPPIPYLPLLSHGLQCSYCSYVVVQPASMARHTLQHVREDANITTKPTIITDVHYQQLFPSRLLKSYFRVSPPQLLAVEGRTQESTVNLLTQSLQPFVETQRQVDDDSYSSIGEVRSDQVNPLVKRLKVDQRFKDLKFKDLYELTELPNTARGKSSPSKEAIVGRAMKDLVALLFATLRLVPMFMLYNLRRDGIEANRKPFSIPTHPQTASYYANSMTRIVLFLLRSKQANIEVPLSVAQQTAWDQVLRNTVAEQRQFNSKGSDTVGHPTETAVDDNTRGPVGPSPSKKSEVEGAQCTPLLTPVTPLQQALVDLFTSLLFKKIQADDFESPMILALGAMLSGKRAWIAPGEWTKHLSAVLCVGHTMLFQKAVQDAVTSNREQPPINEILTMYKNEWSIRGTGHVIEWCLDARAFGLSIHFQEGNEGSVSWDNDRLLISGNRLDVEEIKAMVHAQLGRARATLCQDLLFAQDTSELPKPPLHELLDDVNRDQPGDSLASTWSPAGANVWLSDRIFNDAILSHRFLDISKGAHRLAALHQYRRSVGRFLEQLLVLVHLTYGQPARGTELLSVLHTTTSVAPRNIMLSNGQVCLAIHYNKTGVRPIYRYLPTAVGELILWYLALVKPFDYAAQAVITPGVPISNYLWPEEERWDSNRLSDGLDVAFQTIGGNHIRLREYRHVATALCRKMCPAAEFGATVTALNKTGKSLGAVSDEEWLGQQAQETFDRQAGHSSAIAENFYAVDLRSLAGGGGIRLMDGFFAASQLWHQLLGLDESYRDRAKKDEDALLTQDERQEQARLSRLAGTTPEAAFQALHGHGQQMRGAQQAALNVVFKGHRCVLVVMPTGEGKSLVYQLPAFISGSGQTIVVVPFRALQEDIQRRADLACISCAIWDSNQVLPPFNCSLVVATPEAFKTEAFQTYYNQARRRRIIDRVVIDECHEAMTSFRPGYKVLRQFLEPGIQLICLSATIKPMDQRAVMRSLGCDESLTTIVRQNTTRKTLRYTTLRLPAVIRDQQHVVDEVREQVEQARRRFGQDARVVVQCSTIPMCKLVAAALGCEAHWADNPDAQRIREAFCSGLANIFTTTSCACTGCDLPEVRYMLLVGLPPDLYACAQYGGRAGRDGLIAEVCILFGSRLIDIGDATDDMKALVDGRRCRRATYDLLDVYRTERVRCLPEEIPCEICQPSFIDAWVDAVSSAQAAYVEVSHLQPSPPVQQQQQDLSAVPPPFSSFDDFPVTPFDIDTTFLTPVGPNRSFLFPYDGATLLDDPISTSSSIEASSTIVVTPTHFSVGGPSYPFALDNVGVPPPQLFSTGAGRVAGTSSSSHHQAKRPAPAWNGTDCNPGSKRYQTSADQYSRSTSLSSYTSVENSPSVNGITVSGNQHNTSYSSSPSSFGAARSHEITRSLKQIRRADDSASTKRFGRLRYILDQFLCFCLACGALSHSTDSCPHDLPQAIQLEVTALGDYLLGQKRMQKYSACFKCLAPMALCCSWQPRTNAFGFEKSEHLGGRQFDCQWIFIIPTFIILQNHFKAEYERRLLEPPYSVGKGDQYHHLGRCPPGYHNGTNMMCNLLEHFEWLFANLVDRFGPENEWGVNALQAGLLNGVLVD